jgi:putative serine/threonine protein kinase
MYEFIDGVPIEKLSLSPEEKLSLYMQVLEIAYLLDSLRINRDEFARLDKNLLVRKGQKALPP